MKLPTVSTGDTSATPFLNTLAVETWDTWFRWREDGQLRDVTVDHTWQRVASALSAGSAHQAGYQRRLLDAFCAWQLLLDERVLASAGTGVPQWSAGNLCAVLNAASFVRAPGLRHAMFDRARFQEIAALALQALDDAAALALDSAVAPPRLRLGLIGVSDALVLLGLDYDSNEGRLQAARIAQDLAEGGVAGSIALARDRGAGAVCDANWNTQAQRRGYPSELIRAAREHGLRQAENTAIASHPRLASFANGVADALDPLLGTSCSPLDGYTAAFNRPARGASVPMLVPVRACVAAQLRLRAAMQPWIDERIDYPLCVDRAPAASEVSEWNTLAQQLDLGPLSWRFSLCASQGAKHTDTCATAM